jgi:hypothetical protein
MDDGQRSRDRRWRLRTLLPPFDIWTKKPGPGNLLTMRKRLSTNDYGNAVERCPVGASLLAFTSSSGDFMLVVMAHNATPDQIDHVAATIREMGYEAAPIPGKQRTAVGCRQRWQGGREPPRGASWRPPGHPRTQPYKQVSREWREEPTVVELANGTRIGGEGRRDGGPCSVESEEQILGIAARSGRGCDGPARWCVQAAHVSLLLPGSGEAGSSCSQSP